VTATAFALAMDVPAADLVSATFGTTDSGAVGVSNAPLGVHFPTRGATFGILSTGLAATAAQANSSPSTSTTLTGLNNQQGNDMAQLTMRLRPPVGATCLAFDVVFYSEEFPEYVGSVYNDGFTAEIGQSDLRILNNQIVAPYNFAFDTAGRFISVNTVFGVTGSTATTYDGATPRLRVTSPLEPSAFPEVDLILSIQDLGDSIYDSAVFVDNFNWIQGAGCAGGAVVDTDGDALLDDWEINGIDVDSDGTIDLDLPAMGADPLHRDIFVEVDHMAKSGFCLLGFCFGGHTHKLKPEALDRVIQAFANSPKTNPDGTTGIALHVDSGPDSIMNPRTGAKWGSRSQATQLAHQERLGSCSGGVSSQGVCQGEYVWGDFDTLKASHFSPYRRDVFHYAISGHQMAASGHSGVSRGISGSDFLITLGLFDASVGTLSEQAGTFMHELGHNLSLCHGGSLTQCNVQYKPNYLSIMNYFFQNRGLYVGGKEGRFDYSRSALPTLDESALDERIGVMTVAPPTPIGTRYYCNGKEELVADGSQPINWDCDGTTGEMSVPGDINRSGAASDTLEGFDDWSNLRFDGGAVGKLGQPVEFPETTEADEITRKEAAAQASLLGVCVTGPGPMQVAPGSHSYTFEVTNTGTASETYTLAKASQRGWANLTGIPSSVALAAGESRKFSVPLTIPFGTPAGTQDTIELIATSVVSPAIADRGIAESTVTALDAFAVVDAGDTAARPGGVACVPFSLSAVGATVASTETMMGYAATDLSLESCVIHPQIGPGSVPNKSLSAVPLSDGADAVSIGGNVAATPNGVLFSCSFTVAADAPKGDIEVSTLASAQNPSSAAIPTGGTNGRVRVTTCSGDCDGDGSVSLGEVTRCVNMMLGQSACPASAPGTACPVADVNLNGEVSLGEVTRCVRSFLQGCDP